MGLLRDGIKSGIGAALGAGNANNGLGGGPSIPGFNKKQSGPPDQSKNPYSTYSNSPSPYRGNSPNPGYGNAAQPFYGNAPQPQAYRNSYDYEDRDRRGSGGYAPPLPPRRSDEEYGQKRFNYDDKRRPPSSETYDTGRSGHYESGPSRDPPSYDAAMTPSPTTPSSSRNPNFRPFALPQMEPGDGVPFMRAYSSEIESYGISETAFIHFLDDLNVAVVPNPEIQIFQKAANIAGWFIPGAGSLGLVGGQILVGIGGAIGKKTAVSKCLANANLALFLPVGLEVVTCTVKDVNQAAGVDPSMSCQMWGGYGQNGYNQGYGQSNTMMGQGAGPMDRIMAYGNALAPPDIQTRVPLFNTGRQDPIAALGRGLANREKTKSLEKAAKKAQRNEKRGRGSIQSGNNNGSGSSASDVKWLLVRQASPKSLQTWQQTLNAAQQEEQQAAQEGRPPM